MLTEINEADSDLVSDHTPKDIPKETSEQQEGEFSIEKTLELKQLKSSVTVI